LYGDKNKSRVAVSFDVSHSYSLYKAVIKNDLSPTEQNCESV